jgi:outer membrane protein
MGGVALTPATSVAAVPQVRKVALVDMQRVLNETKQGKKARGKLEKSSEAKSKKLEAKRKKLESEMAKLEGKSGAELAQLQEKLQRDYMELQQMYMQLQQDLAVQENELLEQIYKNSQTIVNGLAKEYGVDLVLIRDDSTVLYADSSMDVTAELVKRYDAKYK